MAEEPFSSAKEIAEQSEKERRQLVLDYRAVFNGERGQKVLADLHKKFGFARPSAVTGMRNEDVWLREGMKMPFHEIERMRHLTFKAKQRQRRALTQSSSPPGETQQ